MRKITPLFIFILFILLPLIGFSQAPQAINNNLFTKSSSFNLDELKVRWKKAALENCHEVPCTTPPTFTCGTNTISDIDGNAYNTVIIGTQCWTKENLSVSRYNNGDNIPIFTDNTAWSGLTTGARCWYNNDSTTYEVPYGNLYNWYAATDARGICPTGWHVPSDADWTVLTNYLGGISVAGGKMKVSGTAYWNDPNTGATNESGFSVLPGGSRWFFGSFSSISYNAFFWVAYDDKSYAWFCYLYYYNGSVYRNLNINSSFKTSGASVRCLRD